MEKILTKDPVCGMDVETPSKFFTELENKRYDFCSEQCLNKFLSEPDKYVEHKVAQKSTYKINNLGI